MSDELGVNKGRGNLGSFGFLGFRTTGSEGLAWPTGDMAGAAPSHFWGTDPD